jgi:hypothetical protein
LNFSWNFLEFSFKEELLWNSSRTLISTPIS